MWNFIGLRFFFQKGCLKEFPREGIYIYMMRNAYKSLFMRRNMGGDKYTKGVMENLAGIHISVVPGLQYNL